MKFLASKMITEFDNPVRYYLGDNNNLILANELIGRKITIKYTGNIYCANCGKKIKKTYFQGFCYDCFLTAPQASECIINPHLCKAHIDISLCRDADWSEKYCLADTYVYFVKTDKLKVGVTNHSQIPTRWIDQGAYAAIKLAKFPNRYLAGKMELFLKNFYADKTDWRKMLKNNINHDINLLAEKDKVYELLDTELLEYMIDDDQIITINYPVNQYPEKVKSLNLDKNNEFTGILTGIKGQYLIFDDGNVLNIRKYTGYELVLSV